MEYIRTIHQYSNIAMQKRQKNKVGVVTLPRGIELTPFHISFPYFRFPLYELSDSGNKDTKYFGIKCINNYKSYFHKPCEHIIYCQTRSKNLFVSLFLSSEWNISIYKFQFKIVHQLLDFSISLFYFLQKQRVRWRHIISDS